MVPQNIALLNSYWQEEILGKLTCPREFNGAERYCTHEQLLARGNLGETDLSP
jgi:hypothetical protein